MDLNVKQLNDTSPNIKYDNSRIYNLDELSSANINIIEQFSIIFKVPNQLSEVVKFLYNNGMVDKNDHELINSDHFYELLDCNLLNIYLNQLILQHPSLQSLIGETRIDSIRNILQDDNIDLIDYLIDSCQQQDFDSYIIGNITSKLSSPILDISEDVDKQTLLHGLLSYPFIENMVLSGDRDNVRYIISNDNPTTKENFKNNWMTLIFKLIDNDNNTNNTDNTNIVIDIIKKLISMNVDINSQKKRHKYADTVLIYASRKGRLEIVRQLLKLGLPNILDIKATNLREYTALIVASLEGHVEIVRLLIENGDDVNTSADRGYTSFIYASQNGHVEVVRFLIENGADVNVSSNNGTNALIEASSNGHIEVVKLLIENGAGVNTFNNYEQTPLIEASKKGHVEIVRLLLNEGANVKAGAFENRTSLFYASEAGQSDITSTIENTSDVNSNTINIYLKIIKLLIDNGADVNAIDDTGWTPLIIASSTKNVDVVRLLIENGADVNHIDNEGTTPISIALSNGNIEIVRSLIENGADDNYNSDMLLLHASRVGTIETVRFLIEQGVNIDAVDDDGLSSLINALYEDNIDIAILLIENDADVDSLGYDENTPLMIASESMYVEIVELLIEYRAEVNERNDHGQTALTFALEMGNSYIRDLLIANGADIKEENDDY